MSKPSPREIESYRPTNLGGFACDDRAIQALVRFANQNGEGGNLALTGDVGSGKTSLAEVVIRTVFCSANQNALLGPCGQCEQCKRFDFDNSDTHLFAHQLKLKHGETRSLHYWHLNGFYLNEETIRELKFDLGQLQCDRSIVFLDEIQGIKSPTIYGHLLEALVKPRSTWLAAGTDLEQLPPAIRRRLGTFADTSPSEERLVRLIRDRCEEWGIRWDSDETLAELVIRCRNTVSDYLSVLSKAASDGRRLTLKLVNDHVFTR